MQYGTLQLLIGPPRRADGGSFRELLQDFTEGVSHHRDWRRRRRCQLRQGRALRVWMFGLKLVRDVSMDFHERCGGQCPCATLHTASLKVAPCSMSKLVLAFGIITGRAQSVETCWLLHFCCINLL